MILRAVGDRIEGEKIAFWFGKVHIVRQGRRFGVNLGFHGEAVVLKPLKKAPVGRQGKAYPRLYCRSADGEGNRAGCSEDKVRYGNHRAFEGKIEGEAWCRIVTPAEGFSANR